MVILRTMVFAAIGLIVARDHALGEIYQYTDEHGALHMTTDQGSIPEKARKRVKVVDDEDRGPSVPPARTDDPAQSAQGQAQKTEPQPQAPAAPYAAVQDTEAPSAPAVQPAPPVAPLQQPVIMRGDTRHSAPPENDFVTGMLNSMLKEKFKDVKDPSQIPALKADPSADCANYKKALDEDVTKMDALMKDAKERRARGESETLLKLRAIWGIRHLVNLIYDVAFTPKNCMEEFERENKDRLEAFGK